MSIFDTPKIRFISHRGFQPMAPENSLPSFAYAGALGQWAIETDVRMTADGELVCCHDDSVERCFNGEGSVKDMTYSELSGLRMIRGNRLECFDGDELRIPKFSEYLAICKRFGSVPFIELKTNDVERVMHEVRKTGFSDGEVVISSIVLSHLTESRRCSSGAFLHWIFADENRLLEFSELGNVGYSLMIGDVFTCPAEKIAVAHDMGMKICLRAGDNVETLKHMQRIGLDYIPTNCMHEKLYGGDGK